MGKLDGKIIIITGGCGQIGYATCKALSNEGGRIISFVRRDLESAQKMMRELPNSHLKHIAVLADIKDSTSLKAAISSLDINTCDILINNAGRSYDKVPYRTMTDDIVNDLIDTNIKGPFYVVREILNHLLNSTNPIIINISSTSAQRPGRGNLLYSASKAALDNMTKGMAFQLAPKIRVIGVAPTWLENACSGATQRTEEQTKAVLATIPLKRIPAAEEVAETILTISTGLTYMTGQIISIDCGVVI